MIAITNNKVHNSIKFKGKVVTKRKRGAEGSVASNHMSDRLSNKPLPGEETTATPTSSTKRKTINKFDGRECHTIQGTTSNLSLQVSQTLSNQMFPPCNKIILILINFLPKWPPSKS